MRFNGEWLTCDHGFVRPIIRAEILNSNGGWWPFELLIDTGADRSVISADVFDQLQFEKPKEASSIGGAKARVELIESDGNVEWDDASLYHRLKNVVGKAGGFPEDACCRLQTKTIANRVFHLLQ